MRAVLCRDFSGPAHLEIGEAPEPVPADDEILIDVHAASVTFMDYLLVSGGYQMRPPTPFVPGTEAAGIVVAVGKAVARFRPGDRAVGMGWTGGMGERMAAKEWKSVQVPAQVPYVTAATVIHSYNTAWYGLALSAGLKRGETVLVTGAAGGVGMAALDLARHLGARVIAGVGSDGHVAFVREQGFGDVIAYHREDVRARIKELTGGRGLDVCFDNIGGAMFEDLARSMRWGGRLLPIGFTSGEIPRLPMNLPLLKNFSVVGVFTGAWEDHDPDAALRTKETLMELVAAGALRPRVGLTVPLERIGEAMAAIGGRSSRGRVVLTMK